jgi:hypothetical protein
VLRDPDSYDFGFGLFVRLSPDGNALAVVSSNSFGQGFFIRLYEFNASFWETRGSGFYGDFVISNGGDGHLPVDISESYPFTVAIGGINEDGSISLFHD